MEIIDYFRYQLGWISKEDYEKNAEERRKNAAKRGIQADEEEKKREQLRKERGFGPKSTETSSATPQPVASSQPVQPTVPTADQAAAERQSRSALTTKKSEATTSETPKKNAATPANNSHSEEWHRKHAHELAKLNDNTMIMIQAMQETAHFTKKVATGVGSKGNLLRI